MKHVIVSLMALVFFAPGLLAQDDAYLRPASLGVHFTLVDYTTAHRIRSTSVVTVQREDQWAKLKEMSPGLAISYFKGLKRNIDFAGTISGAYLSMPIGETNATTDDKFLMELDASAQFKLFSEKYLFTPYLNAGVGISYFNEKFGAIIPLGIGAKFNLFNEAAIFANSQYRVPLTTETNNYHFFHSIGIAGVIGRKKTTDSN